MQTQEATRAAKGVGTTPRRSRRLEVLLTFVAVLATLAVMAWLTPDYSSGTGGVGVENANPKVGVGFAASKVLPAPINVGAEDANLEVGAGSAVVHDDAGNMPLELHYPLPHGKEANAGAVPAVIHDDAGNVLHRAGTSVVHDDAGNMPGDVGSAIVHDDAGNMPGGVKLQ